MSSNSLISLFESITGNEESAKELLVRLNNVRAKMEYPRKGSVVINEEDPLKWDYDSVTVELELSPLRLVVDSVIPEEFTSKYVAQSISLNSMIYSVGTAISGWEDYKSQLQPVFGAVRQMQDTLYLQYIEEKILHSTAKKRAEAETEALAGYLAGVVADIVSTVEDLKNFRTYLQSIAQTLDRYSAMFPHVQEHLTDSHRKYLRDLIDVTSSEEAPQDERVSKAGAEDLRPQIKPTIVNL